MCQNEIGEVYYTTPKGREYPRSRLSELWESIIGVLVIPYDLERRQQELSAAYAELSEEVAQWKRIQVTGQGRS